MFGVVPVANAGFPAHLEEMLVDFEIVATSGAASRKQTC